MQVETRIDNRLTYGFRKAIQSRETGLLLVLAAVSLILTLVTSTFATFLNVMNILKQVTLTAMIATSQTFVITSGGIDLSVGFVMGLGSIIMCTLINWGIPLPIAILGCLLTCVCFGGLNGILITRLRLPPFIITLGMNYICKGFINVITEGYTIMIQNDFVMALGQGTIGGFPIMVLFLPVVAAVMYWLFGKTLFGNHVKGIGGNETACHLSGINVRNTKVLIYALNGLICGLVGVIITGRLNAGNPNAGVNFDMNTIGSVIIGGTAISGGSGTVLGSILGAILLGVIRNGLTLLKVNMYWETVATGVIIIMVCAIDSISKAKRR
jgi:ribose transport system permease protein